MSSESRAIETRSEYHKGVRSDWLVGTWPDRTTFSGSLVIQAEAERLRRDGDRIAVMLADTAAVYRIDEYDEVLDLFHCTREA